MIAPSTLPAGNRLLDAIPMSGQRRLRPKLEVISCKLKDVLYQPGDRIEHVYFPLTLVASLLNLVEGTAGVEIATIGNEGLVGLPLSWGSTTLNPQEIVVVQVPGDALRMGAAAFQEEMKAGRGVPSIVRRYTQAFFSQLSQQVACNGLHSIEERCARWILLTHDRVGSNEFPLTHEFLAQMLGVRRPSVTVVAGMLQQAGFIRFRHGRVTVVDRAGLEGASCECYRVLREVFDRLVH
jgi:CRP-like cAMP-binding protein